jgi:threonine/homoserine/homoserine lactone efflux protein
MAATLQGIGALEQVVSHEGFWGPLFGLVLTALVIMGSPGPSTMSVTAVGAAFGLRRSLAYLSGLVLGTIAVLLCIAAGLASVMASMPALAPLLLAVSAAYIAYLAFRIATAPPLSARHEGAQAPSFMGGFLLAALNPKAYLAIGAVFAGATFGPGSPMREAVLKTAVLSLMIVVIHLSWLFAGASLFRVMQDPTLSRIVNILFAVLLLVTTVLAIAK